MRVACWNDIWHEIDSRVRFGMKPGLERMQALMDRLGHPERSMSCIQVAGTNGKGTTAYALAALLGLRRDSLAGLFVSPHVIHPAERIRVGGHALAENAALAAWKRLEPWLDTIDPSYFELLTALALEAFAQAGVKHAVLECGLGGRFDATSVVTPELAILTSIGEDHLCILGPTLEDVARDKAHVAPPGGALLSAVAQPVLREVVADVARQRGARVVQFDPGSGRLESGCWLGRSSLYHTAADCGLVLPEDTAGWRAAAGLALEAMSLLTPAVPPRDRGLSYAPCFTTGSGRCAWLEHAEWPGRFQVLSQAPPRVLDVAHNPPALARLCEELARRWPGRKFRIVLAGMRDKDLVGNLAALKPCLASCWILCPTSHERAAGRADWERAAALAGVRLDGFMDETQVAGIRHGLIEAPAAPGPWEKDALLVTGSFLSVAAWLGAERLPPGL